MDISGADGIPFMVNVVWAESVNPSLSVAVTHSV